jgi:heat shock protein HslJ
MYRAWLCCTATAALVLLGLLGALPRAQAAPLAQGAPLPAEMLGFDWELVSLQAAGTDPEDTTGLGLSLGFEADGSASGSGGCNRFRTSYQTGDAQSLTFTPIASTLIGCPDPISAREQSYLQTLEAVSSFALENGRLRLQAPDGELVYVSPQAAAPPDEAPATPPTTPPTQLPTTGEADLAPLGLLLLALVSLLAGRWLRRLA